MNRRLLAALVAIGLVAIVLLAYYGCGRQGEDQSRYGGGPSSAVPVSGIFDVSGAKAIAAATAASASSAGGNIKALSTTATDILKYTASGEIYSIINLPSGQRPPISVIEKGPDGSLYIGFQWGVWISGGTTEAGQQVAFFRIYPNGTAEAVDTTVWGIGGWYGSSNNGELPEKQVQFDNSGNIYYIGASQGSGGTTTALKKKTTAGVISQIGNSQMQVRDFYVCPNGFVLFHGSNSGNWNMEWLRVIYNNSVNNIFHNSGATGWLRSYYYVPSSNSVVLVGSGLEIEDQNGDARKYSGIIQVSLSSAGAITSVRNLYDDENMYSDSRSVSEQILWGYWDGYDNKKFFITDSWGSIQTPVSLESGVSEEGIRTFIRSKYYLITSDALSDLTFTGMTVETSGSGEAIHGTWANLISTKISAELAFHINGATWKQWKDNNGLQNVSFGWAKQLVLAANGMLCAVMKLDSWSGSAIKGDRLYRIIDASARASIEAAAQHATYKYIDRAKACGSYIVYLASKAGKSKILRMDPSNPTTAPVDLTPNDSNIAILSFYYSDSEAKLYYDVYKYSNNTSYLREQSITSTTYIEKAVTDKILTDVVSFTATN